MDELIRELKRQGVLMSPYVDAAFWAVDRKDFVRPEYRRDAYANHPLPIGFGQTISQPYTVAFMLDLLDPQPGEKVLDVGSGSGWQTAILAHVISKKKKGEMRNGDGRVYAIERIPELCAFAKRNIGNYGFIESGTAELICGDATLGLPRAAPFDKIIAAAGAGSEIPQAWRDQLKVGGRIAAPVGNSVWRYTKKSADQWEEEEFPGFAFVPLLNDTASRDGTDAAGRRHPLLSLSALAAVLLGLATYAVFVPLTVPTASRTIEIASGAGSREIGMLLKAKGIVRSKWAFVAYASLTRNANRLKPGAYTIGERTTIPAVVASLVRGGRGPNERLITIPEGWDLRDIAEYFEQTGIASREEFFRITGVPARRYGHSTRFPPGEISLAAMPAVSVKPPSVSLEGYLYPDTYRVFLASPLPDIVTKMLENFEQHLTSEFRAEISRQGRTITSVITVASLVEKEAADADERRVVAGIIWKRLDRGIPLQIDASVNYVSAKRGTPSADDLAVDSSYNTYRYPGLPPGPIANPGEGAIRAALYPQASGYLYYLSSPDGLTVFSRTLEEHNAAKSRHLGR